MWAGGDRKRFFEIVLRQYQKLKLSKLLEYVDRIYITAPALVLEGVKDLVGSGDHLAFFASYGGDIALKRCANITHADVKCGPC